MLPWFLKLNLNAFVVVFLTHLFNFLIPFHFILSFCCGSFVSLFLFISFFLTISLCDQLFNSWFILIISLKAVWPDLGIYREIKGFGNHFCNFFFTCLQKSQNPFGFKSTFCSNSVLFWQKLAFFAPFPIKDFSSNSAEITQPLLWKHKI